MTRIPNAALLLLCGTFLQQAAAQDFRTSFETQPALSLALLSRMNFCTEMGRIAGASDEKRKSGMSLEELLPGLDKAIGNLEAPDLTKKLVRLVAVDMFTHPRPPGMAVEDEVTLTCNAQLTEQVTMKSAAPMPEPEREALGVVMSKDYIPLGLPNASHK
ncbi:hypothetical protein ACSFA2_25240 [Variovorax sp. LT2P21]|uniref:hypothetical protein n=1 Tax=Variovorax sp. LT2P21 TaxID=3443731 RepID=UPI003F4809DA